MLTASQRANIRNWMGWSARYHEMDRSLENALDALSTLPDDEAVILVDYNRILDIEDRLFDTSGGLNALDRMKVGAIGNIRLNANEVGRLRNEAALLVERIAHTIGVKVRHNAFRGGSGGHRLRLT